MSDPHNPGDDQQPAGQAPYGGQPAYGQGGPTQPYGQGYPPIPPEHPQGTIILILGILGFFTILTAPFAWVMGGRALRESRAAGITYSNQQNIVIGRILGIVFSILGILSIVMIIVAVIVFVVAASSVTSYGG